ncbi:MAG: SIS domain-containing protein [Candidatus Levybacteria bacterium]|nr:SIS domain-containing protein [Candidatus Levybacteria bacterium]
MNKDLIIKAGKAVLKNAARNILITEKKLDNNFVEAVNILKRRKGKIIAVGIGKSGIIANKFSSTISSTGNLCIFVHPTEAFHGDFGKINEKDVLVIFCHSGETKEIIDFLMFCKQKNKNIKIISITSKFDSTISLMSNVTLTTWVEEEHADPRFKLIPTTSASVTLALSDALIISLQTINKFQAHRFYKNHPGGHIGEISRNYN